MTVVQNVARAPGGAPLKRLRVKITLVTGRSAVAGYTSSGDIVGLQYVTADDDGAWSTDLVPNSAITPANTYYRIVEATTVTTIVVRPTGGPYQLIDLLSAPPPTPSAPGLTGVNVSVGGTLKGKRGGINLIAGTNTTISGADNPTSDRVDVTVTATGGGGGGSGSVNSVNGHTPDVAGNVALTAADLSALASSSAGATNGTATLDGSAHLTGSQAANLLAKSANLSDVADAPTARTNLGLGTSATRAVGTATGTVAAGDDSRITDAAQKASNLSDLADAPTARTNLGLGGSATRAVGTATGTVAAGDDSRITGAAQKASNLSDLANSTTARTNLGLGTAATENVGTIAGTVAAGDDSRITGAAQKSANLSDLASASSARSNIGAANRLTPTGVKTGAYTAQAGDLVPVDATAGTVPITLVSAPADGTVIAVKMIATASGHTATVTCGGTDVFNKAGGATTATLTLTAQAILLQYSAGAGIWYVVGDDLPLTQLDSRYVAKSTPATLTDGATIATDASLSALFRVTLGGNRTLSNPTNGVDGQLVTWMVKQDGTGSRTLTLDTKFRFGTDITSITLTTTPGKTDHIGARYNSGDDKWDVVAFVRGF